MGYDDSHEIISKLKPLNPYGESKNEFDKWVLNQGVKPSFWVGLKFFNVYGPNEYHKNRMSSVVINTFNMIKSGGKMNLFRSHKPEIKDGEQKRDFVYIKDVTRVIDFFYTNRKYSGIYNLGTGKARTFNDLARCTFRSMGVKENISYIDIPEDIRDNYQYFTEAKMEKLYSVGYNRPFFSLEEGIDDYVKNYLNGHKYM
jgi:ADP-L-glycero-D-manno-heptose 6-epimerase